MTSFCSLAFCVVLAFAANKAVSAEVSGVLTLEQLVAEALEKNPEIRALKADIAAAAGEVTSTGTLSNPELTVTPGTKLVRSEGSGFHGAVELTQTFEFPGKRALRRAAAEKDVEIRQLTLEEFRFQLTIQVRRAFNALLVSRQILTLKEQQYELAKAFADAARKKVEGGFAAEFEATKADVEVVSAQRAVRAAQAQNEIITATLNLLLGRAFDLPVQATGALSTFPPIIDVPRLRDYALSRNPSLKIQTAEVQHAMLNLQAVRKSRLPDFTIGPDVEYTRDEQTIGIGISLPLPLWNPKKGEIATATAEYDKALAETEKLKQEILRKVISSSHSLAAAKDMLDRFSPEFRGNLKAALDAAAQSYAEGRTSLLIYLETQHTYFDTQADYFDILQQLYDAQADLEAAVGVPLGDMQKAIELKEK